MSDSQPLIAVRIKDGIFVGNVTAAHDEDFLYMNKVTHILNCAGAEVPDLFADSAIEYLSFPWKDTPGVVNTTVMFDSGDRNIEQAVRFIDRAQENGDCVLVHSVYGISRSPALVAAYFMVKYGWKVDNALSFLSMAHQEMNIKPHFLRQLRMFAKRHEVDADVFSLEVDDSTFALDNDQWMLRNTLLNGLTADVQSRNELYGDCANRLELPELVYKNPAKRRRRLAFVDTRQGTTVGSTASTPVVNVKAAQRHYDPQGSDGAFPGAAGARAVRSRKPKASIAARHGTPNSKPLESKMEVNAKGRQILTLRSRQTPAAYNNDASRSRAREAQYPEHPPVQPVIIQRGGQSTVVDTTIQRKGSGMQPSANAHVHNPPTEQRSATAPANVIRSPFALTSSAPRNGSPLPMQRQQGSNQQLSQRFNATTAGGASDGHPSLRGTAQPPPVHEIRSSATVGQPLQARASSPVGQPSIAGSRRTSSPLARSAQSNGQSTSMTTQMMAGRASSPRGAPQYSQPTLVTRRPSSPVGRGPQGMPLPSATTAGNGSSSSGYANGRMVYSSASTLQQQRAQSPTARTMQQSTALPRTSSPMQRPSNVVNRTASPQLRSQQQGSRTSSPMRSSLADQYLGAGQLPRTSSAPSGQSTVLRRAQPTAVAARRV